MEHGASVVNDNTSKVLNTVRAPARSPFLENSCYLNDRGGVEKFDLHPYSEQIAVLKIVVSIQGGHLQLKEQL